MLYLLEKLYTIDKELGGKAKEGTYSNFTSNLTMLIREGR